MEQCFLTGQDVDRRLSLRPGTADRLARRGLLPHVQLPNGIIRFAWDEIASVLSRQPKRQGVANV